MPKGGWENGEAFPFDRLLEIEGHTSGRCSYRAGVLTVRFGTSAETVRVALLIVILGGGVMFLPGLLAGLFSPQESDGALSVPCFLMLLSIPLAIIAVVVPFDREVMAVSPSEVQIGGVLRRTRRIEHAWVQDVRAAHFVWSPWDSHIAIVTNERTIRVGRGLSTQDANRIAAAIRAVLWPQDRGGPGAALSAGPSRP